MVMTMSLKSSWTNGFWKTLAITSLLIVFGTVMMAQTTVGTGSIVGTVTDPQDAVVSGARVTITNTETGQVSSQTSNAAGAFSSGALTPGQYKVQVSAKGFSSLSIPVTVQVGNTASANAKLQLGAESQVIEVAGTAVQVNTEQATVQGVLTSSQIENLPVNGRNFLDLAQLEPGVQIQDGQNFDPTKAGYSSVSFGGRFGRTARINVDGVDISDETVGTTTSNVSASAIDEFQLSQSSLDLSQDLTSSGAINVSTKSGTNTLHGEAFGFFRDASVGGAAAPGGAVPSQRSQFGGRVGGPIIKDKLFYFLDGERTKQDAFAPVIFPDPFTSLSSGFNQAFRETNLLGKADYNLGHNARVFYRYTYYAASLPATFAFGLSVYDTKNYTRNHVVGLDFSTGSFTHSVRFSYLKFQNGIVNGLTAGLPNPGILLSSGSFFEGPNLLAPQATPQANREIKYDGTKALHSHTLRYGVSFNHIQGGGFANFYGLAPRMSWTDNDDARNFANNSCGADNPCFPGGASNPLNYEVSRLRFGNGQGFNTEHPAFGFPAGGLGPDNRIGIYLGDSWKVKPNFTVNLGLRYDRDTNRTDSDLGAIPEINAAFPGWGNPVQQANLNLAPQLGIAWDPGKNGKTVIRAGIGMFYENAIYNNVLFDRPLRLRNGAFNTVSNACLNGAPQTLQIAGGNTMEVPANICSGSAVGTVIPQILQQWQQYLAGNPTDLQAANPNFVGNDLASGTGTAGGVSLFAPNYKSPRSVQMNFGIQREIRNGMVFSADYLRNIETRSLLGVDINHDGSVSNFSLAGAQAAVASTLTACGASSIDDSLNPNGSGCAPLEGTNSVTGLPNPATIADYAGNGLGSGTDFGAGCTFAVATPCAFGGINPGQSAFFMLEPIGRSVYNALQMKLVQNVNHPFKGVKYANFQISYSLSRLNATGGAQVTGTPADSDQDFVLAAADYNNPGRYFGPSLLDRTHQLSFGGYVDLPGGFRFGVISHFYSPLSSAIVGSITGNAGDIFVNDYTGDGTVGDPLPGTHFGQFDRGTNAKDLTSLINNYNNTVAGTPTPAGQVLIANGVMTQDQLVALGGVAQPFGAPVGDQVNYPWLKATDLRLAYRHTFKERFTIEPSIGFFNAFNFANFNLPPNTMNGLLDTGGAINTTGRADNEAFRVGNGTGVYALGAGRQIEWGLRLTF
jgi:hypothetical protein